MTGTEKLKLDQVSFVVVVDTNVLLSALQWFDGMRTAVATKGGITIVPRVVLSELDGMKVCR